MPKKLKLLATVPGREAMVLDELRAEFEAQHGRLFNDEIWSRLTLEEKEGCLSEMLEMVRPQSNIAPP